VVAFTVEFDDRKNYTDYESYLIDSIWDKHRESLLNLIGLCKQGLHGTVTDDESEQPVYARVIVSVITTS